MKTFILLAAALLVASCTTAYPNVRGLENSVAVPLNNIHMKDSNDQKLH